MHVQQVNVLLEGSETATEPVVSRLRPHLRRPLVSMRGGTALALPTTEIGTLILDQAHSLTTQDQTQLLEWLNAASTPRVISTSSQPLFPCVELGLFAEVLYYRLNVVLIRIEPT